MSRTRTSLLTLLLAVLLLPALASALPEGAGEMTAEQQEAMMQAWAKAAVPGEEHEMLAKHVGTWKAEVTVWMGPDGTEKSEGTFRRELMLGGRVLQEHYEGSVMGQPFQGFGLTGYDNVTGRWWSTWNDSMSTGPMMSWGEWSDEENGIVYYGKAPDPFSGEMIKSKIIVRYPEDGKELMQMFDLRTGEPVKNMEIVATRQ